MRRAIRFALVAAAAMAITPAAAQPKERVVNVYNWSDYMAPGVVEDFSFEFEMPLLIGGDAKKSLAVDDVFHNVVEEYADG